MKLLRLAFLSVLIHTGTTMGLTAQASNTPPDPAGEPTPVEKLVDTLESMAFFGPQTIPTGPRPVERLISEWDPAEAAIISIHSLPAVLGMPASYEQYAGLISHILPMLDVMVLYPEKEQTLLGELIQRLEEEPGIRRHTGKLFFYPVAGPTMWLRDNGPQFGLLRDNSLAVFDFAARPFMDEAEAWTTIPAEIAGVEWEKEVEAFEANRRRERLADSTPVGLIRHLRLVTGHKLPMSRPPISLQGGDYVTDGRGNIFISQESLMANGGDQDMLEAAFRKYVGPFDLHLLFPLPGNTPKHLDMVLKFVDESTVLIAAPPPVSDDNRTPYLRRLAFGIEAVLTYNRKHLESSFPGLRVIEVPLLPLVDESPSRILNRLRWRILARVCELNGLEVRTLLKGGKSNPMYQETNDNAFAAMARDLGKPVNLDTLEDLQAASLHYLRTDINTLVETNVPFQTIYRSFVNGIHLVDTQGNEKFLLPRFAPREGEDEEVIRQLHRTAEKAYREARPGALVEWVEADVAADLMGGLHCMAITLPAASQSTD